jgi:hypothetical protein
VVKAKTDRPSVTREILVSLLLGTSFTLLIAMLRSSRILPESAEVLLRPGAYVARITHANDLGGAVLAALGDGVVYGLIPFLVMGLLRLRRKSHVVAQATARLVDRRRSSRMPFSAPVFVYGYLRDEPFAETTETLNVSYNGGLVTLSVRPVLAQELVLVNPETDEEMRCRVTRYTENGGKSMAGVEFLNPSATFWHARVSA